MEYGEPEWIEDISEDPSFLRAQLASDIEVKSGIVVPVPLQDKVVAILEFFSEKSKKLDKGILRVLESIGVQLGRVFERESGLQE